MTTTRKLLIAATFALPIAAWLIAGWLLSPPAWAWLTLGLSLAWLLSRLATYWERANRRAAENRAMDRLLEESQRIQQPRPPTAYQGSEYQGTAPLMYRDPATSPTSKPPSARQGGPIAPRHYE